MSCAQREAAGAQVVAADARAQREEEARADDALVRQQVADLARARALRDHDARPRRSPSPFCGVNVDHASQPTKIASSASGDGEQQPAPGSAPAPRHGHRPMRRHPRRARLRGRDRADRLVVGMPVERARARERAHRRRPAPAAGSGSGSVWSHAQAWSPSGGRRRRQRLRRRSATAALRRDGWLGSRRHRGGASPAASARSRSRSRRAASRSSAERLMRRAPRCSCPCRASQSSSSTAAARESSLVSRRGGLCPARGDRRREALVVEVDGHCAVERRAQAVGERARLARLVGVSAGERQRQADDDPLDLALGDELAQRSACRPSWRAAAPASIGVASVPVASLSAQPQRAEP